MDRIGYCGDNCLVWRGTIRGAQQFSKVLRAGRVVGGKARDCLKRRRDSAGLKIRSCREPGSIGQV